MEGWKEIVMPDKFVYVKRGYDPVEADKYIDSLEEVVKSYKEKDAAIKNAILNAQIAADNITQNAENQAETIRGRAVKQLADIAVSVDRQKQLVKEFENEYNALVRRYLKEVNEAEILTLYAKINELEDFIAKMNNETDVPKA